MISAALGVATTLYRLQIWSPGRADDWAGEKRPFQPDVSTNRTGVNILALRGLTSSDVKYSVGLKDARFAAIVRF